MKTIETYRLGPTNYRGSRIKAVDTDSHNSVILPWNYEDDDQNHRDACLALLRKMYWRGDMVGGGTKRGKVWVFLKDDRIINPNG